MEMQLYMWSGTREMIVARHDFYVDQIKSRVFAQFSHIELDAEKYGEDEFSRLSAIFDDGRHDEADVAEMAHDRAEGHYALLSGLKVQMYLASLAGLYHQWDKELRDFIETELHHYIARKEATAIAWDVHADRGFAILSEFGWDCKAEAFYSDLDACRLVVNVYKHGKGRSLNQLADRYPEFLDLPTVLPMLGNRGDYLDHEWLRLSETQFDRIAGSLRAFWNGFPERAYVRV